MDKRSLRELKIDRELQSLVVPLSRAQYAQLEADVRAGRCREPLLTWRGCILEEYERYEICARHHIEIPVAETAFKCREAVTAWLCAGQLERTDLTEQTRRCLMGIWLEAEKALNREKYGHPKSKETERRIAAPAWLRRASRGTGGTQKHCVRWTRCTPGCYPKYCPANARSRSKKP